MEKSPELPKEKSSMSQAEIERCQKKGTLCWRPVEDENGNFKTCDQTKYQRDGNGCIKRAGGRKRQSKKERLKARRKSLFGSQGRRGAIAPGPQICVDCSSKINPLDAWVFEGVAPLCKTCFDIRMNTIKESHNDQESKQSQPKS